MPIMVNFLFKKKGKPEIEIETHSWLQNNNAEAYSHLSQ